MTETPENLTDEMLESILPVRYALMALECLEGQALRILIELIETQEHEFQKLVRMHSRYAEIAARSEAEEASEKVPTGTL